MIANGCTDVDFFINIDILYWKRQIEEMCYYIYNKLSYTNIVSYNMKGRRVESSSHRNQLKTQSEGKRRRRGPRHDDEDDGVAELAAGCGSGNRRRKHEAQAEGKRRCRGPRPEGTMTGALR